MIQISSLRKMEAAEDIVEEVVVGFVDGVGAVEVDIAEDTVAEEAAAVAIIRITKLRALKSWMKRVSEGL